MTVDYITDAITLDLRGGERLLGRDRTMTGPGRILLLDHEGILIVRDELDDQTRYVQQRGTSGGSSGEADVDSKPGEEPGTDDGNMGILEGT